MNAQITLEAGKNLTVVQNGCLVRAYVNDVVNYGPIEDIVARNLPIQNSFVPNVAELNGNPVHLIASGGVYTVATQIEGLPLKTNYVPYIHPTEGSVLTPCFRAATGSITLSPVWYPHADTSLWFLFSTNNGSYTTGFRITIGLYDGRDLWRLPYPNCGADGSMCMGAEASQEINARSTRPLLERLVVAMTQFDRTAPTDHLTNDNTYKMFAVRSETGKFINNHKELKDIRQFLSPISSATLRGFSP